MNHRSCSLLILVLFLALLAVACNGATAVEPPLAEALPTTEPSLPATELPTTAPTTAPSRTPPPAAAPTETAPPPTETPTVTPGSPLKRVPEVLCCRGRTLTPGHYAAPSWLGIPLGLEVGDGWRVLNEERALLFMLGRGENVQKNPSQIIAFLNASSATATPERLIAAVQGSDELTTLAEPVPVTIAGYSGLQLDSVARPNPDEKGDPSADIPPGIQYLPVFREYFAPGFLWTTSSPEARVRTVALTVGEQTLLLYLEAPPGDFEQFAADANTLLQTLQLTD